MSFLTDDAALWAVAEMEKSGGATHPFGGNWNTFETAFKARFETINETTDARDRLKALRQTGTVAAYIAEFEQLMGRTGFSENDLRDRMNDGLSEKIKDALVPYGQPTTTFAELKAAALALDARLIQRRIEKDLAKGKTPSYTAYQPIAQQTHITPFQAPARDPNAMDIDATRTRTREEFLKSMTGKCFGCGSTAHVKANGAHERDICTWCGRTGHRETVCQNKFMGRPKRQTIAATQAQVPPPPQAPPAAAAPPVANPVPTPAQTATIAAAAPAPAITVDMFQQLVAQTAALAAQVQAMQDSGF